MLIPYLDVFSDNADGFSALFRRLLSMSVDNSVSLLIRNHILAFFISAFQSLDNGLIRKECAPLVSISIWHHLSNERARETKFEQHPQLRKAWRAATKRYEAGDETIQARLQFERSWLYSMIMNFVGLIYPSNNLIPSMPRTVFPSRLLLILLQAQPNTASAFSNFSLISKANYQPEDILIPSFWT